MYSSLCSMEGKPPPHKHVSTAASIIYITADRECIVLAAPPLRYFPGEVFFFFFFLMNSQLPLSPRCLCAASSLSLSLSLGSSPAYLRCTWVTLHLKIDTTLPWYASQSAHVELWCAHTHTHTVCVRVCGQGGGRWGSHRTQKQA